MKNNKYRFLQTFYLINNRIIKKNIKLIFNKFIGSKYCELAPIHFNLEKF